MITRALFFPPAGGSTQRSFPLAILFFLVPLSPCFACLFSPSNRGVSPGLRLSLPSLPFHPASVLFTCAVAMGYFFAHFPRISYRFSLQPILTALVYHHSSLCFLSVTHPRSSRAVLPSCGPVGLQTSFLLNIFVCIGWIHPLEQPQLRLRLTTPRVFLERPFGRAGPPPVYSSLTACLAHCAPFSMALCRALLSALLPVFFPAPLFPRILLPRAALRTLGFSGFLAVPCLALLLLPLLRPPLCSSAVDPPHYTPSWSLPSSDVPPRCCFCVSLRFLLCPPRFCSASPAPQSLSCPVQLICRALVCPTTSFLSWRRRPFPPIFHRSS